MDNNGNRRDGITRRQLLKTGLISAAGLALPLGLKTPAAAAPSVITGPKKTLSFYNNHTGELLRDIVYWVNGSYHAEGEAKISKLMRDHRTGEIKPIDPALLDLLFDLCKELGNPGFIHIVSGYRSPATNEKLRKQGRNVARKSLHMEGRATDFAIPGKTIAQLRTAALNLNRGGVGYYPKSGFLHVDTGRVRTW